MKNPRIVGALFVGIALVVVAFFMRGPVNIPLEAAVVVAIPPRTALPATDGDGDGLRDWEEDLYGTNPTKADMTSDGFGATTSSSGEYTQPETVTEQFAVDFFGKYFEGRGTSGDMDEATQAQFIKDAAQYATAEMSDQLFTEKDIRKTGATDQEAIRAYGNRLADALTKHTVGGDNEVTILERALQNDSEAELAGLNAIVDSYNKTVSDVLLTPVPAPFEDAHVALLNNLLALHNNIAAMRYAFKDALPAMVRFQRHPDDLLRLGNTLTSIKVELSQRGVTYQKGEAGYLWSATP